LLDILGAEKRLRAYEIVFYFHYDVKEEEIIASIAIYGRRRGMENGTTKKKKKNKDTNHLYQFFL
jgi:hypothetical protein